MHSLLSRHPGRSRSVTLLAAGLVIPLVIAGCSSSGGSGSAGSSGTSGSTSSASAPSAAAPNTPAAAASGSGTAAGSDLHAMLPSAIQSAGVVKVASTFGYPPEEFYGPDNKTPMGISVDLANALGKVLGVKFEFANIQFNSIIPGLLSGRYDVAIAAMSETPERAKQLTFVLYMNSGGNVMVRAGNPKNIKSIEDLCGKSDADIQGTTFITQLQGLSKQYCTSKGKPAIKFQDYQEPSERLAALINGRADFSFTANDANAYSVSQSNGKLAVVPGIFVPGPPYGIAMNKNNTQLAKALQAGMKVIIGNGEYAAFMKKWGVADSIIKDSTIVG